MPLADVVALWQGVPRWSMHEENTARLLDLTEWRASVDYATWTTPPDEVEMQRLLARRRGERPPAQPVIVPVALRPEPVADQRWEQVAAALNPARPSRAEVYLSPEEADQLFA